MAAAAPAFITTTSSSRRLASSVSGEGPAAALHTAWSGLEFVPGLGASLFGSLTQRPLFRQARLREERAAIRGAVRRSELAWSVAERPGSDAEGMSRACGANFGFPARCYAGLAAIGDGVREGLRGVSVYGGDDVGISRA